MASSNRHWPSMFKSKPCNTHHHHHQWQHDINPSLMASAGCHRSPYSSVSGCEERSPEPKPRWNPKPEQIRILEAIFNSGMVNPPRDEIRKIRAQLQEYGQVGDANVFYWFQNRKSRSKHKLRHLQSTKQQPQPQQQTPQIFPMITSAATTITTAPSSSSSSSEKSPPKGSDKTFSLSPPSVVDVSNSSSPTDSVNNYQAYFHAQNNQFLGEPFFFQVQQQPSTVSQGFCFSELTDVVQAPTGQAVVGPCTSLLLNEIMNQNHNGGSGDTSKKEQEERTLMKMQPQVNNYTVMTTPPIHSIGPPNAPATTAVTVTSTNSQIQGAEESGAVGQGSGRSTVFINDVAFEVAAGPFNVRDAFGEDAVLIHSSGQPVLTNEWGVTLQPLQHGSFYYLI